MIHKAVHVDLTQYAELVTVSKTIMTLPENGGHTVSRYYSWCVSDSPCVMYCVLSKWVSEGCVSVCVWVCVYVCVSVCVCMCECVCEWVSEYVTTD